MIEIMVAVSSGGELGLYEGAIPVSREVHVLRASPSETLGSWGRNSRYTASRAGLT